MCWKQGFINALQLYRTLFYRSKDFTLFMSVLKTSPQGFRAVPSYSSSKCCLLLALIALLSFDPAAMYTILSCCLTLGHLARCILRHAATHSARCLLIDAFHQYTGGRRPLGSFLLGIAPSQALVRVITI